MPHVIFLIHGMGDYVKEDGEKPSRVISTEWHDSAAKALEEAFKKIPRPPGDPTFKDLYEIVYINYDMVFNDLIQKWGAEATKIGAAMPGSLFAELTDWMRGAGKLEDNFFWTHVADVLLYRFSEFVYQNVKVTVAKQIVEALNNRNSVSKWSIIAHSLGTKVAHDVLDGLKRQNIPGINEPIISKYGPPIAVAMVANVCRALDSQKPPFVYEDTRVIPWGTDRPNGACQRYVTFAHAIDPFAALFRFNPQSDDWVTAAQDGLYASVAELRHVHDLNVHAFEHYLKSPLVHFPLFRALGKRNLSKNDPERDDATSHFTQIGDLGAEKKLKGALGDLIPDQYWEGLKKFVLLFMKP